MDGNSILTRGYPYIKFPSVTQFVTNPCFYKQREKSAKYDLFKFIGRYGCHVVYHSKVERCTNAKDYSVSVFASFPSAVGAWCKKRRIKIYLISTEDAFLLTRYKIKQLTMQD